MLMSTATRREPENLQRAEKMLHFFLTKSWDSQQLTDVNREIDFQFTFYSQKQKGKIATNTL